jgi:2-oxoacid:acceptor oxidoreductase delta subunit (pyruvate/2-ketoisovalerate family)
MKQVFQLPPWAISTESTLYNKTGSWRNYRPVYRNRIPPCNNACPSGEKIQQYIDILNQEEGLYKAWKLLTQDNPFPAVCGRVCFHPCENSCNRSDYDEPINIHTIERFIGDIGLNEGFKWRLPRVNKKYKIAIIGAGPAGLSCAYHLRRRGYQSTIFEADNKLGGLLSQGIPSYRLPQDIVQAEIARIIKSDVKIHSNTAIGNEYDFDKLLKEYKTVFIAIGAHKEKKLGIPGAEHPSVIPALEFLYQLCAGKRVKIGQRVGIIGGGNSALDAARSVLRLGKKPIVIYRRTENEMPAILDEIQEAKEEQIEFVFLAAPERIIIRNNKIVSLECIKMKLGQADKTGRRQPIPIKGSDFKVGVDTIIPAIGEEVDTSFIPGSFLKVLDDTVSTNYEGVFAGGDAVTGPKTVVDAIGAGKKAAHLIHCYLRQVCLPVGASEKPVVFEDLNTAYFEHETRIPSGKLPLSSRLKTFAEVYQGYEKPQLKQECSRCFSCGVCNKCDNCFVFCPDMSVNKRAGKYEFDYDYCKGCGVCVLECPRNAIGLVQEER